MIKKTSDFDEFFVATLLADLFDNSGSDDIDFIAEKIVNGLEEYGIINFEGIDDENFENEELIAS